jgi:uncharacterized protein
MLSAEGIIEHLGMKPHPEGGHYVETWRDVPTGGGRGSGTAIYFLLQRGERSHWHRVDAVEIWHFYSGDPLSLSVSPDGKLIDQAILGVDLQAGHFPQVVVPRGAWQAARCLGEYSLVGCTVCPAFEFDGFELAPPGWHPG